MPKREKYTKLKKQSSKMSNITINGNVHIVNNYVPQIEQPKKLTWWGAIVTIVAAAIAKLMTGF